MNGSNIIPIVIAAASYKPESTDLATSFWCGNQVPDISVWWILGAIFAFVLVFTCWLDRR